MKLDEVNTLAKRIVADGHLLQIKAQGCSMLPLFKEGDIFFLEKTDYKDLRKGDILAIEHNSQLVLHRLHKKWNNSILLWGDFNRKPDCEINYPSVIGRANQYIRNNKRKNLHSPFYKVWGICVVFFSPLSHYILFYSVIAVNKLKKHITQRL